MFHERQGTSIQSQALMSSSAPGLFHRAWISRALRSFLRMRQRWNALLQTTWSQEHSADFGKLPGQGSAEEGNCGSALSTGSAQGAVCSQEKSGNCWSHHLFPGEINTQGVPKVFSSSLLHREFKVLVWTQRAELSLVFQEFYCC